MESFGAGFGYMFHVFFVDPDDTDDPEEAKDNILDLCYASAILFTSLYLVAVVIFKEKPPLPPTYHFCPLSRGENLILSPQEIS